MPSSRTRCSRPGTKRVASSHARPFISTPCVCNRLPDSRVMASVELAACAGAAHSFDSVSLEGDGQDFTGELGRALRLAPYSLAEEAERVDCATLPR